MQNNVRKIIHNTQFFDILRTFLLFFRFDFFMLLRILYLTICFNSRLLRLKSSCSCTLDILKKFSASKKGQLRIKIFYVYIYWCESFYYTLKTFIIQGKKELIISLHWKLNIAIICFNVNIFWIIFIVILIIRGIISEGISSFLFKVKTKIIIYSFIIFFIIQIFICISWKFITN